MKVTVTTGTSNSIEYNVNSIDDLINKLKESGRVFYLMYGAFEVFHSLVDIINNHELKDNYNYTIVYLVYDINLIIKIKAIKNSIAIIKSSIINDISTLFKQKILYDDPIFLIFLANHLPIDTDFRCYSLISDDIKNNSDVMMKLTKIHYSYLKYASNYLKNNREIILEAVKQNGHALAYSSEDVKNDKKIVLEAVKQNGHALAYSSNYLKNNREIVLEAVKQNGCSLNYVSENLKNDKKIVLEAVKQNGHALAYSSEDLQNDKEFILKSVKQNPIALM